LSPTQCQGHDHVTELSAKAGTVKFHALDSDTDRVTLLTASTKERVGRIRVYRRALRVTKQDEGEFSFDTALTSAHVAPGGEPFVGSAEYRGPDSWMGSLTVSFPGEESVPLAGPEYQATLKHHRRTG
jgi:hypothetical protein